MSPEDRPCVPLRCARPPEPQAAVLWGAGGVPATLLPPDPGPPSVRAPALTTGILSCMGLPAVLQGGPLLSLLGAAGRSPSLSSSRWCCWPCSCGSQRQPGWHRRPWESPPCPRHAVTASDCHLSPAPETVCSKLIVSAPPGCDKCLSVPSDSKQGWALCCVSGALRFGGRPHPHPHSPLPPAGELPGGPAAQRRWWRRPVCTSHLGGGARPQAAVCREGGATRAVVQAAAGTLRTRPPWGGARAAPREGRRTQGDCRRSCAGEGATRTCGRGRGR